MKAPTETNGVAVEHPARGCNEGVPLWPMAGHQHGPVLSNTWDSASTNRQGQVPEKSELLLKIRLLCVCPFFGLR